MLTTIELIMLGLAVWRLTSLLKDEAGPWNVFGKLRSLLRTENEESFFGKLFGCHFCLSMWSAAITYGLYVTCPVIPIILALSTISILLYTFAEPYME